MKVVNLNLDPMTGKHKGFAFIWYDIPEAAQLAIEVVSIFNPLSSKEIIIFCR